VCAECRIDITSQTLRNNTRHCMQQ